MMQWKADLESLVEQTKAMVRNANLKSAGPGRSPEVPPLRQPSIEIPPPRIKTDSPVREEIKQRVAGFKAHQEKLRREREAYYLEMTAKTRAILRDGIQKEN
jgi:hypothetical protein